jgi:hypothetical protein
MAIYRLRHLRTGRPIHSYRAESAALAFVRDVVRFGGREQAGQFALEYEADSGQLTRLAEGEPLVRHALEDRAT